MGCSLIFHRFEEADSRRIPMQPPAPNSEAVPFAAVQALSSTGIAAISTNSADVLIIRSEAFICRKKEKPQKALGIGSPALCGFPTVMTNVADCGVPYGIRPS